MKIQSNNTYLLDDSALWNNLKAGDEKAFSTLFKKYYGDLVRYGNSLYISDAKVQDCVQDVFTDLWFYRETLSENVVVKAYLFSSVRKRVIRLNQRDHVFKQTTDSNKIEFLFDFSIEQQLIFDEETAHKAVHLNNLINNLPSRQKEALYLRYNQGLSVDEIAKMMEVNYQSATNTIFRGIQTLRKKWNSDLPIILLLSFPLL